MSAKSNSRLGIWIGVVAACFLLLVVAFAVAVSFVVSGIQKIGADLSNETTLLTFGPKTVNGQVEFHQTFGKDVTGVDTFTVLDMNDNKVWEISGQGLGKAKTIVYGQLPSESGVTWKQVFPPNDAKPADIRGTRVKIEISTGYNISFGPGHQTFRDEIDIAK